MRKWFATVVILVLAGAMINVAVAWGFAWYRISMRMERNEQGGFVIWGRPWTVVQERRLGVTDVWWYDLHDENPRSIAAQTLIDSKVESIKRREQIGPSMPSGRGVRWLKECPHWGTLGRAEFPDHIYAGGDIAFGFPTVSLWMWTTTEIVNLTTVNDRLHGGWPVRGQVAAYGNFSALPYLVIWPNFILNTLFYGAVLCVAIFVPGSARRRWRRRRGLCERCAYPVGISPVCTECGAEVKHGGASPAAR